MTDTPRDDAWISEMLADALLATTEPAPVTPDAVIPDAGTDTPDTDTLDTDTPDTDTFDSAIPEAPGESPASLPLHEPIPDVPRPTRTAAPPLVFRESNAAPAAAPTVVVEDRPAPAPAEHPSALGTPPDTDESPEIEGQDDPARRHDIDPEDEEPSTFVRGLMEWVVVLVGAVVVALLLRAFLFQAFWIPSESMEMTLREQDRVLVNKLSYRLHDVNRGDVVVFRRPDADRAEIRDLIKRVIGLPGETVQARDNQILITPVDGDTPRPLTEPYLAADEFIGDFGPVVVPDGEFFVMGDNRDESLDSRFFGTVAEDRIVGRAFVLFWPIDRVGTL